MLGYCARVETRHHLTECNCMVWIVSVSSGEAETWRTPDTQYRVSEKAMATHSSTLATPESQGWRSLVGCRLWGCAESDTTEATWQQQQRQCIISPIVV